MVFKPNFLKLIQLSLNSVFNFHNPRGICHITRLKSFKRAQHSFYDTINPLRTCGNDVKSTMHILLQCHQFVNERRTLLSGYLNYGLLENTNNALTQTLIYGNMLFSSSDNSKILNDTIDFILSANSRFDEQFF